MKTKKEINDWIKERLNSYNLGDTVLNKDQEVLMDLLLYHPEASEKLGEGVDYMMVDMHETFPTRCFNVVGLNGGMVDFSPYSCVKNMNKEQILKFKI